MSDRALRASIIRLAHSHPEFRKELLPLVTASEFGTVPPKLHRAFHLAKAALQTLDSEVFGASKDLPNTRRGVQEWFASLQGRVSSAMKELAGAEKMAEDGNWDYFGKRLAGCEKLPEGGMRDNCEKKQEEGKDEGEKKEASSEKVATTAIIRKSVTITVRVASIKSLPPTTFDVGFTEVRGLMTLDFGSDRPDAIRFTAVIEDKGGGWDVRDFQTQRAVSGSGAEILLGVLKSAFEEALEARGDALLGTD